MSLDELSARMIVELLRSGQSVRFYARGSSMWPAIPSRSELEVQPCAASELRAGEVAAFERQGRVVVHRVERVSAAGVHFAGDSRAEGDGCIAAELVLGRARVVERRPLAWRRPRRADVLLLSRALRRRITAWLRRG